MVKRPTNGVGLAAAGGGVLLFAVAYVGSALELSGNPLPGVLIALGGASLLLGGLLRWAVYPLIVERRNEKQPPRENWPAG